MRYNHIALAVMMAAMAVTAHATVTWTLQGKEYNVDTLRHITVGPGTTMTQLQLSGAQNLRLHYTTTDLADPNVDIRVTKAGGKYTGVQTLSGQQRANERAGAHYFSGVNADFFGNSAPIGPTVVDGEVYFTAGGWPAFYMTTAKRPGLTTAAYIGQATASNGSSHQIDGINEGRSTNELIVYNRRYNGSTTGTNAYGSEVAVTPLDGGKLCYAGSVRCQVTSAPAEAGNMAVPADGYVLSGHGTAKDFVNGLNVGDVVTLTGTTVLDGVDGTNTNVWQMAGGNPPILGNGVTLDTQGALDHLVALNPRTAVGYDVTGTKLVLLVVDGRTATSVGVVSRVLADIMRELGCSDAFNFDGGGSSELYSSDFGVINKPSDGNERAVTDAVWCVATSPADDTVAKIAFVDYKLTLPKYGFFTPQIYGYNQYGVLVNTNVAGVTLSCDTSLGQITDGGATLFANGTPGMHPLTAHLGNITCTIPVTIGTGVPHTRIDTAMVDKWHPYKAEITAEAGGLEMPIENCALAWNSDDAAIATVDADGVIKAVTNGQTVITGSVEGLNCSLPVVVETPASRWLNIDVQRDFTTWKLTKSGLSVLAVTAGAKPAEAFDINYTVSSARAPYMTLKLGNPRLTAIPDSLRLVIDPTDATVKSIALEFKPANGTAQKYTLAPADGFIANTPNVFTIPVSDLVPDASDRGAYPIQLTKFIVYVGDAVNTPKTLHVHALQSVYTNLDGAGVNDIIADGPDINTNQALYNLQGQKAPENPAPGLYVTKRAKILIKE